MITSIKELDSVVDRLNAATEGQYALDMAYGGVRLVRSCKGGGETDIQPMRGTKTECYNTIRTILNVIGG